MDCNRNSVRLISCALILAVATDGQEKALRSDTSREAEDSKARVRAVLERDYVTAEADELLRTAIRHAAIAVPEIRARLSGVRGTALDSAAARHADALAYIGNGPALAAASDLCNLNPDLF